MLNMGGIRPSEITFCEAAIINCVEEVGLTHTVPAADTYDPFGEVKLSVGIVLELYQRYGVEK
jgi:hypothetical protein